MTKPPEEVYFLASGIKNRLYTSRGYARLGYNSVRYSWGTDAQVYKLKELGMWVDVTEEFK